MTDTELTQHNIECARHGQRSYAVGAFTPAPVHRLTSRRIAPLPVTSTRILRQRAILVLLATRSYTQNELADIFRVSSSAIELSLLSLIPGRVTKSIELKPSHTGLKGRHSRQVVYATTERVQ